MWLAVALVTTTTEKTAISVAMVTITMNTVGIVVMVESSNN